VSTAKKIIWIDDNSGRKSTADDIGAKFIDVNGKDLAQVVEDLLGGAQPSLIIVDHILDKITSTNPMFQRGSTVAEAIKEKWPACPVVGVTSADTVKTIDVRTKKTYDALFPFYRFGNYIGAIEAIERGFRAITKERQQNARGLISFLKPPDDEVIRLADALPEDLKKNFRDASIASRLYSWVERLMNRPGFLYDSLWAATYLGLNEEGFQKVVSTFHKAEYRGVFALDDDARWWTSQLPNLLYKQVKPESGEMSWHAGRRLPGIKREHYSKCYVCRKDYPTTVAYLDVASDERRAMHLECTVLHPAFKRELYFEDIRMMKGD
jgi:hypothetical protein